MRNPIPWGIAVAIAVSLSTAAAAQVCGQGQRLLKNDILPDNPNGAFPYGVVAGLCENEAAMSLFDAGGPVKVRSVAIGYGHRIGTNGVTAAVDIEIYDGATDAGGGRWTLGPLLWRLNTNGGSNLQIRSTGINTYTLPVPVRVPSGRPVIGFRMVLNTSSGSCAFGYDANFFCDADNQCRPGINILDAIGHGTVDPAVYTGFGVPLCPIYFRGSWVIRCCVEPEVSVDWVGNPTPGGVLSINYIAPGHAGESYVALASGGIGSGLVTPWGRLPLDLDPLLLCFLGDCRSTLVGAQGVIPPSERAPGGMLIPNLAVLRNSGLTLHLAFFTWAPPNFGPWTAVSTPSLPIVIR